MRIAIITDAWHPQINGVVKTLTRLKDGLEASGHDLCMITPGSFATLPCPTEPDIRLAVAPRNALRSLLASFRPDAIHIATEGPLGLAGRAYCLRLRQPFSTSFHTRFPEYLHMRFRLPMGLTYRFLRWFHAPARCVMAPTRSIKRDLEQRGFNNVVLWSRGVDTALFHPQPKSFLGDARPVFIYLGRVAAEKNIEAFLDLDLPGTRYVVGDGPALFKLKQKYPAVKFTGFKTGAELVRYLSAADVFVFPSRTDTFGLVLLEALACGVPVAAYPVAGPIDVVVDGVTGYLDEDLGRAALKALALDGGICREHALHYTWEKSVSQFLGNMFIHETAGAPGCALTSARYTSLDYE